MSLVKFLIGPIPTNRIWIKMKGIFQVALFFVYIFVFCSAETLYGKLLNTPSIQTHSNLDSELNLGIRVLVDGEFRTYVTADSTFELYKSNNIHI